MLTIEITALPNGAHRNQRGGGVPEGWAEVPAELEEEALSYLPFIDLTLDGAGHIVGVAQGAIPEPEPMPEPEPTPVEQMRADLDYLAALQGVVL